MLTPGKLVLAGEYAVLVPGGRGLVLAVGPGVPSEAAGSLGPGLIDIELAHCGERLVGRSEGAVISWVSRPGGGLFVATALETIAAEVGPFTLRGAIGVAGWASQSIRGLKPGLGGSAASTVAAILAAEEALGLPDDARQRFQWAYDAHRRAQGGRGSGIDVAAAALGGAVALEATAGAPDVQSLVWPAHFPLMAVFTGSSTSTVSRIDQFQRLNARAPGWVAGWVEASNRQVDRARVAIEGASWPGFCDALGALRALLLEMGERAAISMEGPGLAAMAEIAQGRGVSKQSGAGGGDVGLFCPTEPGAVGPLAAELRGRGLIPLELELGAMPRFVGSA